MAAGNIWELKGIIAKAIKNSDQIKISYTSIYGEKSEGRIVEPFEIDEFNGMFLAYDEGDVGEIRAFKFSGIRSVDNV